MFRVLLKKQLAEVFKGYFYDAKRNRMRSKLAIAGWFLFFVVVVFGVLGGMFAGLSLSLCAGMAAAGAGWLYFAIMAGLAVLMGVFGGVLNSYSSLYLARDNDLLFSLPIPAGTILASRLASLFLLGTVYASVVLVPALVVYWAVVDVSAAVVAGGIALLAIVSVVVLCLSCLVGWAVAKVSLKLKNKSIVTVLITLAFVGLYYFAYFQAETAVKDLLVNATLYGTSVQDAVPWLYAFGNIGTGDLRAAFMFLALATALLAVTVRLMARGYLAAATAAGKVKQARYVEKTARQRSQFWALVGKELARFASSPTYMLNSGLGIVFMLAAGVAALLNADVLNQVVAEVWDADPAQTCVLFCGVLCLLAASNDIAAPSVSLEGGNIYLLQSLPLTSRCVLRAKAAVHFILTVVPLAFAVACIAAVVDLPAEPKALMCVVPFAYAAFTTMAASSLGVRMANLSWTDEIVPIKHGGAAVLSMIGGWTVAVLLVVVYFAFEGAFDATLYLASSAALFLAAAVGLFRWLSTAGGRAFAAL